MTEHYEDRAEGAEAILGSIAAKAQAAKDLTLTLEKGVIADLKMYAFVFSELARLRAEPGEYIPDEILYEYTDRIYIELKGNKK